MHEVGPLPLTSTGRPTQSTFDRSALSATPFAALNSMKVTSKPLAEFRYADIRPAPPPGQSLTTSAGGIPACLGFSSSAGKLFPETQRSTGQLFINRKMSPAGFAGAGRVNIGALRSEGTGG